MYSPNNNPGTPLLLARNYRPLRPAPPVDSGQTTPQPTQPEEPPAKRKVTEVACQCCRTRKSKCDGATPQCATCVKRGTDCIYPGVENQQTLRRRYQEMELLLRSHQELYDVIQNRSEEEGFEIVRRIRRGHDVDAILDHIRDGDLLLQAQHAINHLQPAAAEARRRLSIQAMLEDGGSKSTPLSRNPSTSPSLTRSATDAMSILAVVQTDPSTTETRQ
ncbi:hypothetical protein PG993_010880 [Apiospora rasikravindrae]|uniref:Zn(2)-C6 fungal-type domain-containing protein n=1 Tax=Apiospora rasikravindrae TaxID=990691 RepID=A0ABR1SCM9_9PEZI